MPQTAMLATAQLEPLPDFATPGTRSASATRAGLVVATGATNEATTSQKTTFTDGDLPEDFRTRLTTKSEALGISLANRRELPKTQASDAAGRKTPPLP